MMSKERELLKIILSYVENKYLLAHEFEMATQIDETFIEIQELLAQPEQPTMTQREAYQRGYTQAELNLKREPLSDEDIRVIINQLPTGVDLDTGIELCRIIEKAHGIGGEE
jgi:murein L,D-transpeptidase YafK